MNAKEMFEELGYVVTNNSVSVICFKQDLDNHYVSELTFDFIDEVYTLRLWRPMNADTSCPIDVFTHIAINQQMIELGWIE